MLQSGLYCGWSLFQRTVPPGDLRGLITLLPFIIHAYRPEMHHQETVGQGRVNPSQTKHNTHILFILLAQLQNQRDLWDYQMLVFNQPQVLTCLQEHTYNMKKTRTDPSYKNNYYNNLMFYNHIVLSLTNNNLIHYLWKVVSATEKKD